MQKSLKILMPNALSHSQESLALSVYGIVQLAFRTDLGETIIPPELIAYHLGYKLPIEYRTKQKIINALECLNELDYIKKRDDQYVIDMGHIYATDGYEFCSADIFRKLMNKPDLLKHYLIIKRGLIDGKCKYSIPYFAKIEETTPLTIIRRNKDLEDMQLIIIYQDSYNKNKNNRNNNVYTLYSEEQAEKKNGSNGNIDRSISQRYNSFVRNPGSLSPLQKKELRKNVEDYNRRHPDKPKDLSVFNT